MYFRIVRTAESALGQNFGVLPNTEQSVVTDASITKMNTFTIDKLKQENLGDNIAEDAKIAESVAQMFHVYPETEQDMLTDDNITDIILDLASNQGSNGDNVLIPDNVVALEVEVPFCDHDNIPNEELIVQHGVHATSDQENGGQNTTPNVTSTNKNIEGVDHDYNTTCINQKRMPIRKRRNTQEQRLHGELYTGYKRNPDGKVWHQIP